MVARGGGFAEPHRHQVKEYSKRSGSFSSSKVPGLERVFRRQVLLRALPMSLSTRSNSRTFSRLAAKRPTNPRIASHALLKLFVGSPHTLATTSQCCTNAASKRDHTRTICRTAVAPLNTATKSCDFQRLNNNSICQRA